LMELQEQGYSYIRP